MPRLDLTWVLRAAWAVLPVVTGPALADALDGASRPVQVVASVALWAGWTATLVALLVPRTVTLTIVRLAAPAPLAAAMAAAVEGPRGADDAVALAAGAVVAALLLLAPVADAFVDGSSYGDERRFALRTPSALLVAAVPVAWLLAVALPAAAALLLAAEAWVPGVLAAAAGAAGIRLGVPAIHRLSRRWLVFVPAGVVVHDHLQLADPTLLRRPRIARFVAAGGGIVAVELHEPTELAFAAGLGRARQVVTGTVTAVPIAPVRPGAVLAEAAARRYAVATPDPTTASPS